MPIIESFIKFGSALKTVETVSKSFKGVGIVKDFLDTGDAVDNVVDALKGLDPVQAKAILESSNLDDALKDAVISALTLEDGFDDLGQSGGILSSKLADLKNGFIGLGNSVKGAIAAIGVAPAATIAVAVAAFGGLLLALYKAKQAEDELRKSAQELGNSYKESKDDIESYKSQIESLYETINSETASTDERREAREKLMSIQDEMIKKYGTEAQSIGMITDAINGEVEALDRLTAKQWQNTKNEFNNQNLKGWDWANKKKHNATDNIGVMLDEMENAKVQINFSVPQDKEIMEQFRSLYGGTFEAFNGGTEIYTLTGSLDEVQDKLIKIQQTAEDMDLSDTFKKELSGVISNNSEILDQYKNMYEQFVLNERIFNSEFEDNYLDINKKITEYNKVRTSEDAQAKKDALNALREEYDNLRKEVEGTYDFDDAKQKATAESILNFFENLHPELTVYLNQQSLEDQLNEVIEFTGRGRHGKTRLQKIKDSLGEFNSEEELFYYDRNGKSATEEKTKAYDYINSVASSFDMSNKALYEYLVDNNKMGFRLVSQEIASAYSKGLSDTLKNAKDKLPGASEFSKAISSLEESERERVKSWLPEDFDSWKTKFEEYQNAGKNSQEAIKEAALDTNKVLEEQAAKIEKINEKLQSDVSHIDTINNLQSATSSLTGLYDDNQKIKTGQIDASTINSVEQAFMGLTEKDESVDAESVKGYIEEFEQTLIQFPNDAEKAQEAIDKLVTSYIDQTKAMKDLNEENKEWTIQELEQMGITNAEEVVMDRLYNKFAVTAAEMDNLSSSFETYSDKLQKSKLGSSEFAEGLNQLKNDINNIFDSMDDENIIPEIDTGFIQSHLDLVKQAAEGDVEALRQVRIEASKDAFMKVHVEVPTDVARANLQEIWDNVNALDGMNLEVGATLDDGPIIAAFENIVNTGKASAEDIAAALGAMGYTAKWIPNPYEATIAKGIMASGGTGNTSADIATSKGIQALETQKVKIDVPSLVIESNGGSSGGGAKMAHYSPTSSGKSGGGGGGGGGGSNHTPTDHSSSEKDPATSAAESAADAQKEAADAAKKLFDEEKAEKEKELDIHYIDWIERLLDKLASTVKKWTDAAEDFFSFWNKNLALNRAIMANHEELVAQQKATKIYEEHAKKAAKKAGRSLKVNEEELTFEVVDDDPLSQSYINKIRAGAMEIETLNGKQTALQKKIEEYITWIEKSKAAQEKIAELYRQERDLITEKLNNILDYYNTMEKYFQSFTSLLDSRMGVKEASGQRKSILDLLDMWGATTGELTNAEKRDFAYKTGIAEEGRSSDEVRQDIEFAYEDTEYYQNMLEQRDALEERQKAYEETTAKIKEIQAKIKATSDKAEKKELQAELKELKAQQEKYKLSSADKKNLNRLKKQIETYSETNTTSALYQELEEEAKVLQERQDEYNRLQEEIAEKRQQLAASKDSEEKKELKKEISELNKQAKKTKLSSKESKNLKALQEQLAAMEDITEQAVVDQATANTANYQELVAKIADMQAKKAAGKKIDETKLSMYLDELAAINQGVLASSLASYIKVYEEW